MDPVDGAGPLDGECDGVSGGDARPGVVGGRGGGGHDGNGIDGCVVRSLNMRPTLQVGTHTYTRLPSSSS